MIAPPQDRAAEEAVIGGILLAGTVPSGVLETGLNPSHFYNPKNAEVFKQALRLHDAGVPIDAITLAGADAYAGAVPDLGNLDAYARRIIDKARWRDRRRAGLTLVRAAETEDENKVAEAERVLIRPQESTRVFDRERLQQLVWDRMDKPAPPGWSMPFFQQRLKRGTVHLWGGFTSHGKTVWVDQIAQELNGQGARVWAWLNEMSAQERIDRFVSSHTGIPLERVECGLLRKGEHDLVVEAMTRIPFEIVECPGWSVEAICRDIRVRRADVAIIDILHRIPYRDERDLARISQVIGDTAKLANCLVIATVHLNRSRIMTAARPQPTMGDIKGASAFEQDADLVGMVWREDDETTGRPTNVGQIYTLKVRQGKPDGVPVVFDGQHSRFERWERDYELAA